MAGLRWMVVVLAFCLSAGNTEAMSLERLQTIVEYILDTYFIENRQFSLAVNIPVNQDLTKLQDLFNADDADTVINTVKNGDVYESNNMVEAIPVEGYTKYKHIYTDHAEARVLDNMQLLINHNKGKSLVFYSYLSPCGKKCANPDRKDGVTISDKMNKIPIDKWAERAFVFSKLYQGDEDFKAILKYLRKTKFGHNIFRCDYYDNTFQCIKCFSRKSKEPHTDCVN